MNSLQAILIMKRQGSQAIVSTNFNTSLSVRSKYHCLGRDVFTLRRIGYVLRFLKNERGSAYVVFWALMLPMLIALLGLGADLSRVQAVHTKLQTAADSAALAAVQTAQEVEAYGYVPQYDSNGNLIELQKVITSDSYEITDPGQARQSADNAFKLNMQNMTQSQGVTVTNTNGQIYSRRMEDTPANQDSYTYWANAGILTFYLGPAMKLVDPEGPDYTEFPVSVVGTASVAQPALP